MKRLSALLLALLILIAAWPIAPATAETFLPNWRIWRLVVTPENPPVLYLIMTYRTSDHTWGWGIFKSTNGGASWARLPMRGLENTDNPEAFAVDYLHPNTMYLSATLTSDSKARLFKSINWGADWVQVGQPFPNRIGLTSLAVDFRSPDVLFAGRDVPCYGSCGEFVISTNGGLTWQPFDRTLPSGQMRYSIRNILINPHNPEVLWAETTYSYRFLDAILLRGDRQGNWMEMPAPPQRSGHYPAGLAFDPTGGILYTGSYRAGGLNPPSAEYRLWKTNNPNAANIAEVAWQEVYRWPEGIWGWASPLELVKPLAIGGPDTTLYLQTLTADTALWRSTDGGNSWQFVRLPPPTNMPATDPQQSWIAPTGHPISGLWLDFLKTHGDTDNLGYPRTPVIGDPMMGGQTVQYFQRMVLEWHPENPPAYRIQRRLLGDILYPGADPPVPITDAPPPPYHYFPFTPGQITGLGHFVANQTRSGQMIYFKDYFDSHGGVDAFGYPKEEPVRRNGMWTQRFQAAVFEYHPEFDIDGFLPGTNIPYRNYRVMLELLGDKYIELNGLPYR